MKMMGRKHRPFFRICVMEGTRSRDAEAIEELGHYDPMVRDKSKRVALNMDRVKHWISVGAQPTEKVAVLIKKFEKGDWGVAKAPPPLTAPKPPKVEEAAPVAEEAAAEPAAEAAAE